VVASGGWQLDARVPTLPVAPVTVALRGTSRVRMSVSGRDLRPPQAVAQREGAAGLASSRHDPRSRPPL